MCARMPVLCACLQRRDSLERPARCMQGANSLWGSQAVGPARVSSPWGTTSSSSGTLLGRDLAMTVCVCVCAAARAQSVLMRLQVLVHVCA